MRGDVWDGQQAVNRFAGRRRGTAGSAIDDRPREPRTAAAGVAMGVAMGVAIGGGK